MVPGNSNGTAARYREHFTYRCPLCGGVVVQQRFLRSAPDKRGTPNERAMSELGHTRTSADVCGTTASLPEADMTGSPRDVAEVPLADVSECSKFLVQTPL